MKTQRRSWPPPVRRIIPLCSLVLLLCLSSCSDDNPSSPPAPKAPAKATSAVAVTDPARGGMLQGGTLDPSAITASGMACDTVSTLTSLSIDGQAVALTGTPPCFDFSTQLDSRWGLNIITGTARNQTGGKTDFVQSYLRSPEYFGVPARERSRAIILDTVVPDGVYTRVNQDLADDGSRYDIDDIATVAQLELSTLNLNAALPNPLVVTPDGNGDGQVDSHTCNCSLGIPDIVAYSTGYRVGRGTLSMGNPVVDYVGLGSDGLHVSISVSNVSMPVSVSGYLDEGCFTMCTVRIQPHATVTGTVHANYLNIEATVGASVGPNGTPVVDICDTCLDVVASGLSLDIDWGGLEFLDPVFGLSNLTTQIILAFRDDLEAAAKASIRPALVTIVTDFLEGLEPPATVTLPAPMNTVLNIDAGLDMLAFAGIFPNGSLQLGYALGVAPANPVLSAPYGSVRRDGARPVLSGPPSALGVGLKDDFLNQFFWAAWSGGAFELSGLAALGCALPGGLDAHMSMALPPVVMPRTGEHQIDIGLGEIYLEAGAAPATLLPDGVSVADGTSLYASTIMGATITIDPDTDKLGVILQDNPEIAVQIVSAPAGADVAALTAEYRAYLECALPKLIELVVQTIPVPSLPVGALDLPGVPADARWGFENGVVDREGWYTTLHGGIVLK